MACDPGQDEAGEFKCQHGFPATRGAETKATAVLSRTYARLFLQILAVIASRSYKVEVRRTYTSVGQVRRSEIQEILTVG